MRWLHAKHYSPIGVDLGGRYLKIAQLTSAPNRIFCHALALMPNETPGAIAAAQIQQLCELLTRRGFRGTQVVIGIPTETLRVETLELPPTQGNLPLHQIAGIELARLTRLPPGSFTHGHWEIPAPARGGTATHALGVALPHAAADQIIAPFREVGLEVVALYPQMTSLAAGAARLVETNEGFLSVIDIGWGGTRLLVMQDGKLLFHRAISAVSLSALHHELGSTLQAPPEVVDHLLRNVGLDAQANTILNGDCSRLHRLLQRSVEVIAGELRLTQNYLSHQYQRTDSGSLLLTGGGAAVPGLAEALGGASGQRTMMLAPALLDPGADAQTRLLAERPIFMGAVANALYALEAQP